ncbi:MAG: Hsp20/alpha crystallin family protein [Candidatus Omnitrophica bacterium]|nr:Hsp20/alpha crystallin family protein [Candidatus Omnitrophota bacterium]
MDKITKWNPFRELLDVRDDFDRIVEGMFKPGAGIWEAQAKVPAVDVCEDKDNVFVKAELPGLKKDEISVSLADDILTLSGRKSETQEEKKENYYRKEIREGSFARSVEIPWSIDRDKITASYKDGVLEIVLPKAPEEKKKEIKVNIQ